ncbi:low molecular weight protein-tyrosine-phosphatase [Kangiella sp. HZ709]|uniref:low molecular weight protein-tyrosine-phosphatase n=1 Tax=Kangiella sp. HZ709 TaxID=2666328 RepID=UPI0012B160C1|nr:low molecular weight protein-tyrosine-phosphatase [Kangiella sp. HZ709]MRX26818.1 low molecular weight phosphotyrosine protein phosphatase [Kangiella sp. HZ709]
MYSVLFVCLGNICRSPTAEGVFKSLVTDAGLSNQVFVDSAGTSAHHVNEAPDPRSQQEAKRHGYDLSRIRSRKVTPNDYEKFDLIIAMDESNLNNLKSFKSNAYDSKLKLFLKDFAPLLNIHDVPDPYYGGAKGFTKVVELVEHASEGLLELIKAEIKSKSQKYI